MGNVRSMKAFQRIDAKPYSFPFDGQWSRADTALLLLGFQQGTIAALSAMPALAKALDLMSTAEGCGLFISMSRRGTLTNDDTIARRRSAMGDGVAEFGSSDWALPPRLALSETALIVDHRGDNAFYKTSLEADMKDRGIRNLVIAGLPTEGLVHATQRAANDMGFECLAVADACQGTSEARHDAQLRITTFGNGLFGTVASTAAVQAAMTKI